MDSNHLLGRIWAIFHETIPGMQTELYLAILHGGAGLSKKIRDTSINKMAEFGFHCTEYWPSEVSVPTKSVIEHPLALNGTIILSQIILLFPSKQSFHTVYVTALDLS